MAKKKIHGVGKPVPRGATTDMRVSTTNRALKNRGRRQRVFGGWDPRKVARDE